MVAASSPASFEEDQHVVLRAMSWQDFEALLAIRGERSSVRMYYLDGEVEIYRRLGVRELWTLKSDGRLIVRILERGDWVEHSKSKLFPRLDLAWLRSFLAIAPQSKAVRALRDALRTKKRRS